MKATFTSGKRKKSNYKLSNIKLNCEDDELIIISSLSNLKKKQNLEKFNNLSSHDFSEKVGGFGDCHLFNSFKFDQSKLSKDERKLCYHSKDQIYLFDNDEDGMLPNIHKIVNKSNSKEISFFVNPSNISTSDFIDDVLDEMHHSEGKRLNIKNNDLVFCCIPQHENITKKFSSNIDLFIEDRIKKKKLVKFKVPNGSYDIVEKIHDEFFYKNIAEFAEHGDLLGHYIKIQSLRSDKN